MGSHFHSKYRLIEKIGEGSFSEVLKCEDKTNQKCYAAKRLKKVFKSSQEVKECPEVVAMTKLPKHANIVYMLEFHYDLISGRLIFIFELMDMSMYDFMKVRKRRLPEVKVRYYLYQILKGLNHLHTNGFFHRDIKPENILMKVHSSGSNHQNEIVKLADFGSIRGTFSKPPYTEYISTRWYRSPECLLTVGYYGSKMDVWAAGCVFYELLMSKPLFPGSDEIDQLSKIHYVLGTPSERTLFKLKKKSRNFMHFPKQAGVGLKQITSNVSDEALLVLQLMIQYDPDVRINIRRLLEHSFFKSLRDDDLIDKYKPTRQPQSKSGIFNKSTGDFNLQTKLNRNIVTQSYKAAVSRSSSKIYVKKKSQIPKPTAARTSIDVCDCKTFNKPYQHMLLQGPGPLVNSKQMKSWGVNPNMIRAKDVFKQKSDADYHLDQVMLKHKIMPIRRENAPYSKTISDLPQISKATQIETGNSKHFQSKSFVIPTNYTKCSLIRKNVNELDIPGKNKKIRKH
ncbi:hypothetical protein FQR65_LT08993 [Abscondita terminalis]|nr:hypothetical protein FQR65_LT08993 [Abscondita terminalis]